MVGDRHGSRRAFRAGLVVFGVASLACGAAPSAPVLIAGRAIQGLGAALAMPNSLALLSQATRHDPGLRARAVGVWTAAGGVAIATGPILGGVLVSAFGWRSIFLVNVPVCAVGLVLTARVSETVPGGDGRSLDVPGQLLAVVALASLIGALIETRPLGWSSPAVAAGLLVAVGAGACFVATECWTARPMLPLRFFRLPSCSAAVAYGVLTNLVYYGVVFVLSLYLQDVRGFSPREAGLAYLPLTASFIVVNVISGWLVDRVGSRTPMVAGRLIGAFGFALLTTLHSRSPYPVMLPAFLLIPAGVGLGVPDDGRGARER